MKPNRTKWIVVLAMALVAAVALSQTVNKPGHMGGGDFPFGGHMLGFFADYLDLTDAQQTQVKDILAKEKPALQPLLDQMKQSHQQLRQIAESGSFDEAKVRAIAGQQSQTMTELAVQKTRIESELFQVLTPEQKIKMGNFLSRQEQRFRHMQDSPQ
jgi:Spy/CpxP family protein refolding chaperone